MIQLDSLKWDYEHKWFAELDGWHFEASTLKALINQLVKYAYEQGVKDEIRRRKRG